nr:uncharacterized protein LOC101259746 isoform X1 [Solanum lycopersicum]
MVISMYACVPLCHPSIFPLLISLFSHQSSHHLPETLLSSKAFPDFSIKCEDRNLELLLLQSQRYSVILFCNMVGNTILFRWCTLLVLIAWTLLHCYKKLIGAF